MFIFPKERDFVKMKLLVPLDGLDGNIVFSGIGLFVTICDTYICPFTTPNSFGFPLPKTEATTTTGVVTTNAMLPEFAVVNEELAPLLSVAFTSQ